MRCGSACQAGCEARTAIGPVFSAGLMLNVLPAVPITGQWPATAARTGCAACSCSPSTWSLAWRSSSRRMRAP